MPVIEIDALMPDRPPDVPAALGSVAADVAAFLGEEPGGTFVVLRPIVPGHYAEGNDAPASQPTDTHPAIVRVFANRPPQQVAGLLEVVGTAVVRAFGLSEGNVFVRFEPADSARMYWG